MRPQAALLAFGAAAGVLLSRALDATGLLVGVHEPAAVRAAAGDPRWTAIGLLAAVVIGVMAECFVRIAPRLTLLGLVLGQLGVLMGLEELARAVQHAPEGGGDAGLWVAVGVQALVAMLVVSTALLVLHLDLLDPVPAPPDRRETARNLPLVPVSRAWRLLRSGGTRAPPSWVKELTPTHDTKENHEKHDASTWAGPGRPRPASGSDVCLQ